MSDIMLNVFGECSCLMVVVVCVSDIMLNVFGECSCLMVVVVCVRHYVKCVW